MTEKETQIETRERRDPWTEVDRMFDNLRSRFYDAFGFQPFGVRIAPFEGGTTSYLRSAPTDITDTGTSFKVTAEVPGIPKEKLEIHVRGSTVEIRGEQEEKIEKKAKDYVHQERTYQGYYRLLELPEPVVAKEAKASLKDGVLELALPKESPTPAPEDTKVRVE